MVKLPNIPEIVSKVLNINTDRSDDNESESEAEPSTFMCKEIHVYTLSFINHIFIACLYTILLI